MPYLRLYLPEISIAQKRHIARELMDTTLRSFPLAERNQITVQFLSRARRPRRADCKLEVRGRDLDPESKTAFVKAVTPMLIRSLHLNVKNRLSWLMGSMATPPRVDVEFVDLSLSSRDWTPERVSLDRWESRQEKSRHPHAA
jgi:phenylpyruvate tautomerase PptA (4-oxalocrotonate tautomerase family)